MAPSSRLATPLRISAPTKNPKTVPTKWTYKKTPTFVSTVPKSKEMFCSSPANILSPVLTVRVIWLSAPSADTKSIKKSRSSSDLKFRWFVLILLYSPLWFSSFSGPYLCWLSLNYEKLIYFSIQSIILQKPTENWKKVKQSINYHQFFRIFEIKRALQYPFDTFSARHCGGIFHFHILCTHTPQNTWDPRWNTSSTFSYTEISCKCTFVSERRQGHL